MSVRPARVDETLIWQHRCGSVVVRPAARGAMWCPRCGTAEQQWWRATYTSKRGLIRTARRGRARIVWLRQRDRVEMVARGVVIGLGLVMFSGFFLLIWRVVAASL